MGKKKVIFLILLVASLVLANVVIKLSESEDPPGVGTSKTIEYSVG